MSQVIVRQFSPESDSGAIYSSWPNCVYYSAITDITIPKKEWFAAYYLYVKDQLEHAHVSIACLSDSPNTIVGFCVVNGTILEWVSVKEDYRKEKIATLLLKNQEITGFNKKNLTKVGFSIMEDHPGLFKESISG